jgi:hypothetical protein
MKISGSNNNVKTYLVPRFYRATHNEARAFCRAYDMDLAMVQSLNEFNAVVNMLRLNENSLPNNVLIDGISPFSKSKTEWSFTRTGEKIPFNIPWASGEPNDSPNLNERCLSLIKSKMFLANDYPCNTDETSYLCEKW